MFVSDGAVKRPCLSSVREGLTDGCSYLTVIMVQLESVYKGDSVRG